MSEQAAEKPQSQLLIEETVELNEIHAATNLNLVKIEATEEQDEEVFSERAALYRFSEADSDWKERARGDLKILRHKASNNKYRLVMHAEKIMKLRLNQFIGDIELKPNAGSASAWNWRWLDFATETGEGEVHTFAVRFKTPEQATKFKEIWEIGSAYNKQSGGSEESAPAETKEEEKPTEDKKEEEKKEEEKPTAA